MKSLDFIEYFNSSIRAFSGYDLHNVFIETLLLDKNEGEMGVGSRKEIKAGIIYAIRRSTFF